MTRQQLIDLIHARKSFLCVGLDVDKKKMPEHLRDAEDGVFQFNKAIIDATIDYCVAYKPNLAFYESMGIEGLRQLKLTMDYLHSLKKRAFIIADAKRGDIGNTSQQYAKAFLDPQGDFGFDALTIAPYMGEDSVTPFTAYPDRWVILLALTSNKGSHDFQLTKDDRGERLFEKVIRQSQLWGDISQMMYVVGATQGSLFADIRRVAPRHFLLVPGVGAQGGSLEEVCKYGMTNDCGLIVNSSRGIIYADTTERFAEVAGEKARELQQQMASLLPFRE